MCPNCVWNSLGNIETSKGSVDSWIFLAISSYAEPNKHAGENLISICFNAELWVWKSTSVEGEFGWKWERKRYIKYLMAKSWRFIHSVRIVITSTMLWHNYWSGKRSIIVITHCFGKQKATPLILIMISCRLFVTANTKSRWRGGERDKKIGWSLAKGRQFSQSLK